MYTTIIIIFSIIVLGQLWYIIRLRKAIEYAAMILKKYESALLMDGIIRKVNEKDELKAD
jgi:hypothetical protein